jgi:hypothetical protein
LDAAKERDAEEQSSYYWSSKSGVSNDSIAEWKPSLHMDKTKHVEIDAARLTSRWASSEWKQKSEGTQEWKPDASATEFDKWASADASATESEKWASGSWKQTWQVGKRATSNDSWKVSKDEARLTPRVQENTSSSSTDTHWRSSAAWKKGDKWTAGAKWIEKKQSETTPTVVSARIDLDALD